MYDMSPGVVCIGFIKKMEVGGKEAVKVQARGPTASNASDPRAKNCGLGRSRSVMIITVKLRRDGKVGMESKEIQS